ncbi:malate dehydrogenase (quinone) [Helicobacter sp. 23-1048]
MNEESQVVLVGGGIMSLTLATLLKEIKPDLHINIYEQLDDVALESSDAWNNAGTGHQALCELNYTPQSKDGSVDIKKALTINQEFELSKEFWAYCVKHKILQNASSFIHPVPHMSFVTDNNVAFLKARYEALHKIPFFHNMRYTQDKDQISQWTPLLTDGRESNQEIATTFMNGGSDVDFGAIVRQMAQSLAQKEGVNVFYHHKVVGIKKEGSEWHLKIKDDTRGQAKNVRTRFVFLGAGGATIQLLQKSGVQESKGYSGLAVNGLWLVCKNKDIIQKHHAKVYGKASVGAPPMSVPHLDTRFMNGNKELMFGPYAGFNTRFLKNGSLLDFPSVMQSDNFIPMMQAGIDNIPLTIYLLKEVMLGKRGRIQRLQGYMPSANSADWEIKMAGVRVQIIKKDANNRGFLQFGTEVIVSQDGSLAALLGASPGASTSVNILLEVLEKCFKDEVASAREKLKEMIPSYQNTLEQNIANFNEIRSKTAELLGLPFEGI